MCKHRMNIFGEIQSYSEKVKMKEWPHHEKLDGVRYAIVIMNNYDQHVKILVLSKHFIQLTQLAG